MRRIWVDPNRKDSEPVRLSQNIDTAMPYKVDFAASATDRGTTVSSVAWESKGGRELAFTNESLTSGVAQADITSIYSGYGLAKVTATFADGNTEVQYIRIDITDPEYY